MSRQTKRNLIGGTGLALLGTFFLIVSLITPEAGSATAGATIQRIEMEARDLAFEGNNPTLELLPGQRVRMIVRNTDPGVLHTITIPGIDDEVRHIASGESIEFEFTVPDSGTFEYICPQHSPRMQGTIRVAGQ